MKTKVSVKGLFEYIQTIPENRYREIMVGYRTKNEALSHLQDLMEKNIWWIE
jgi:hypothetical protein